MPANIFTNYLTETLLLGVAIISLCLSMFKSTSFSKKVNTCSFATVLILITIIFGLQLPTSQHNLFHLLNYALCFIILSLHLFYPSQKLSNPSVAFLVIISFIALFTATKANNFLSLYVSFEIIAFCGYITVSLLNTKPMTSESSVKYFITGGISSAIMLFGISFIYGSSNSINFSAIVQNPITTIGTILFLCGIFFKLTAFPFHFWASDVYSTTSLPTLSVIAIIPKIAGLFAITNFLSYIESSIIYNSLTLVAIASMLIGAVGGIFQSSINRILAYSGIANIGFILSIHSAPLQGNLSTVIEFTSIYAIAIIFTIATLLIVQIKTGKSPSIETLQGLHSKHPFTAFTLTLALLSLGGLPPLAGFFAKWTIIKQLIQNNLTPIAIILVLTSAILLFPYLKIIKNIYFNKPSAEMQSSQTPFLLKAIILSLILWTTLYFAFEGTTFYTTILQNSNSIFYVF